MALLAQKISDIYRLHFVQSVLKLSLGTGLSQIITFAGYIILARLYVPEQFGVLAFITSVAGVLSAVMALRYEMTILIERGQRVSDMALTGCVLIAMAVLTVSLIGVYAFSYAYKPEWLMYIWIVPILSFAKVLYNTGEYYFNRYKRYNLMSGLPILRSILMMGFAIVLSGFEYGLIYGFLIGHILTTFVLAGLLWRPFMSGLRLLTTKRFWFWAKKNRDFPFVNGPASFVSTMAGNLPVFLITAWFGTYQAGLYSMLMQILKAPIKLVSISINKVIIQNISARIKARQPVLPFTRKAAGYMFIFAPLMAVGIILMSFFDLFSLLFGKNWIALNELCLYLMPAIVVGFVSKSISRFAIYKRNMLGLKYQVFILFMTFSGLFLGYFSGWDFKYVLLSLSSSLSIAYIIQILLVLMVSKQHDAALIKGK